MKRNKENYKEFETLNCNLCPIYGNCISSIIKYKDVSTFEKEAKKISYKKNSQIFISDHSAENLYIIISGQVKLLKEYELSNPVIMYIVHQGEYFGYSSLIDKEYLITAHSFSDITICMFNKSMINKILINNFEFNQMILNSFYTTLRNIIENTFIFINGTMDAKVAQGLIILSNNDGKIDLTKEEIALIFGSTRETVSRTINKFKRKGLVEIDKSIIYIKDKISLKKITKELRLK
ncbi:MAG: Crp/Fnr family transcriptional regulator [Bacteroidia bacterium]|nr:Crp/Fnr family transcriptional regulator [Bacteroidia bacterium]